MSHQRCSALILFALLLHSVFIDATAPSTRLIGDKHAASNAYCTSVLAKNGKIYAAPLDANQVLEIDPIKDPNNPTTRLIGDTYS
eukprot:UC4_evm1s1358